MKKVSSIAEIAAVRAFLNARGAEVRSMLSAVVKKDFGRYWRDVCVIKFSREGDIQCSNPEYAPSEDEQKAIKEGFEGVEFPMLAKLRRISDPPPEMAAADKQNIFEFRDLAGDIVMVQVRMNTKGGGKKYLPFTYWSDQRWRNMEPEGPLPLYNLDRLKNHGIAFLHEGPKAAAHCQWLASVSLSIVWSAKLFERKERPNQ